MKKISVIVPVYNVEKYIDKCLDSLVNQTLKEIEIIVVNDGSPDNSQKIIDKYKKKYPKKIKSIIKENGGQGSARNIGLKHATGEYIGYVDSDDYVDKTMFEKLYTNAKENNSDIAICGTYIDNDPGIEIELEKFLVDNNKENAFFGKMAVWNKIYKRSLLVDNKLEFRSKLWYEDFDFSFKAIAYAQTVSYVNEPLYYYLIRPGSTMNNSNIQRNLEILQAFDKIKELSAYKDIQKFLAIDHIYISTIVRVLLADCNYKNKKIIIKKILIYLRDNFGDLKKNKYLSLLSRNRRIIYTLLNLRLYKIVMLLFKIKKNI